jgi:catechol 2,3-dioxygenase-like lactoylglutathione lyase family enzyme
MHLTGLVHVNVNCTDYDRSLAFYERLGFREFWQVPETNSPEVAAAVGMPPYRVRGALLILEGADPPFVLDLLEWREPRDETPPTPVLYRPGIARIALATSNLDADYAFLEEQGVDIVAPPATVMVDETRGSRFFCFRDPDGTFLELVESVGA